MLLQQETIEANGIADIVALLDAMHIERRERTAIESGAAVAKVKQFIDVTQQLGAS